MSSYNIKDNDDGVGVGDNTTLPNFPGQRLSHYSHLNVDTGITANQSAITWQIEIVSTYDMYDMLICYISVTSGYVGPW